MSFIWDPIIVIPFIVGYFNPIGGIILLLFLLRFLYSPELDNASNASNGGNFICPSDGYIREIREDGDAIQISLFLNVLDNHTQYVPINSIVTKITKYPTRAFYPAFLEHSINNERVVTHFEITPPLASTQSISQSPPPVEFSISQITGILTRRIKTFVKVGEQVQVGQRFGFIVLGSRVDIHFPRKYISKLHIIPGQRVKAGEPLIRIN